MKRVKLWLGIILLGLLCGCGKPVRTSDLPGTYVADFGFATDTLTINADGRSIQTIKIKAGGRMGIANGTWRYEEKEHEIHFSEFMVVIDGFSKMIPDCDDPKNRGPSFGEVRRLFGKLEIGGDDLPWGRIGAETPYTKVRQ